ncbi:replication initiation factor domain-containing protein [Lactobacillus crispatus]|uniref:Replication initiation factor domain-containing protein n=1 Tax=Lactobacillus crispatus TaxID=47770 RepID=A0AAW8WQR0_9LACO|nr:replication initiation factor domain-containing protein [Lactobacillus crispatus]MDK6666400.1 replication initiation factor domain-containing protein [Lactobacillus crispatus]MDK8612991.1 replication initiation factor domain-containing protein [Lactobacillus crispatus]MDT9610518.1 replication initiation factor domain-containing protein [Lactobacillus crispatus]MDT9618089.1 replication initiation factor domain-containing protein [Lactobacillus crispatus]
MNQNIKNYSLTPYVTTPPEVYFLHHSISNYCTVSIDRITISGKFHAEQYRTKLKENHWRESRRQVDGHPKSFELDRVDKNGEITTIANILRNPNFKPNSWRIDTSNHIRTPQEKQCISNVIALFDKPHVTRLDIAVDFINWEHAGMRQKMLKPNTAVTIEYGKAGNIETIYCGKRKSNLQYRYYDKKLERKQKKKKSINNISNWERLELQLRSSKYASNWQKQAMRMLDYFKRPNLTTIAETNPKSYLMLAGIVEHPEIFKLLTKRTKAKYRKMIKDNQGFDTTLADRARKELTTSIDRINQEISVFFEGCKQTKKIKYHKDTRPDKNN